MLDIAQLKELAHGASVGQRAQLLLVLAVDVGSPKSVKQVKELAAAAGIHWVKKANVSDRLARTKALAIRTKNGWELSPRGKSLLSADFPALSAKRTARPANDLRRHLVGIASQQARAFLEEAIACSEHGCWRAAVVLSWCGAVAVLHDHVVANQLLPFNAEARRRDPKWKDAKTSDDLGRLKEHDFLDHLAAISVLGKNVKRELQDNCLALRNGCGHPNTLRLSEARVAAHLEVLILNVFARF